MSDNVTKRMLAAYFEEAEPKGFLSSFFRTPPRNFFDSEKVEIDIKRKGRSIAIPIKDISVGARKVALDQFTNKEFTPPVYKESGSLNAFNMIKRQAGQNPFQDPDISANAIIEAFNIFRTLESRVRRATEVQASMVFASGVVTLIDNDGDTVYSIDYSPKATHFINAPGGTWSGTPDIIGDLDALAELIRADGKSNPDTLIFGRAAYNLFIADTTIAAILDSRRMALGALGAPQDRAGASFKGTLAVGAYQFNIWLYNDSYDLPSSGADTPYVATDHVLMLSSMARLDAVFGSIPQIIPPDSRVLPFLPRVLSSADAGLALTTNVWATPDGETISVAAGTRPLMIPTAIDSFGRLDVVF